MEIKNEFIHLENLLSKITIPYTSKTSNRRGFPKHRKMTFGYVKQRYSGKYDISAHSKKHNEIYNEILKIGRLYCPFEFNAIHLNCNVICPPHFDSKNVGDSMIISCGNYTGCNLVIEGKVMDAKYNPIIFNGALKEHYNTNDLEGTKYSLVYYRINLPEELKI